MTVFMYILYHLGIFYHTNVLLRCIILCLTGHHGRTVLCWMFFFTLYKYIWNKKNRNMCRPGHGSANLRYHYCDVIMGAMVSQTTSLTIVYPIVHSGADQRKYQRSASLAFVWEIHRWPVNSLHKWPVTRKCFHLMTSCEVWIWDFVDNICYKTGHDKCGNSKLKPKKLRQNPTYIDN